MLYQYINEERKVFNLAPHNNFTIESENIFTTIVGQNGTGKSRLLESIIKEVLSNNLVKLDTGHKVKHTIAISMSPFDKFPHPNMYNFLYSQSAKEKHEKLACKYSYLGVRDSRHINFSQAYMSKVILSLLKSLFSEQDRIYNLLNILDYIGYKKSLILKFSFSDNWEKLKNHLKNYKVNDYFIGLHSFFEEKHFTKKHSFREFFYEDDSPRDKDFTMKILNILEKCSYHLNMELTFENNKYTLFKELDISEDTILFMLEIGILKLNEVILIKKQNAKVIKINEASSGEQSVIMSMLGIASKINNGSLICIDEPEVCLHPTWQEKYIKFLIHTFKDYKGCHFLLATHSPQITSKLEDENCYVMSMDDGKLVNASTLNNKSIDFQLAHVFKSPGFKNEYLTRELISLITLISEGKGQEELYSSKITEILALKDVIDDDDPVKELIKMVESVKKEMS